MNHPVEKKVLSDVLRASVLGTFLLTRIQSASDNAQMAKIASFENGTVRTDMKQAPNSIPC